MIKKFKWAPESLFEAPITIEGNCFFASDFHFGSPNVEISRERERRVVAWLEQIKSTANYLFLLGDIFDFWFEYRYVVPKGFYLFFAKLKELQEKGIQIYYFTGNHDMWVKDYFEKEFGCQVFKNQQAFIINRKRFLIGHGDGLGNGELGYKFIKLLFASHFNIWLYGLLPSKWAFGIASYLSRKSRAMSSPPIEEEFQGMEKEKLVLYIQSVTETEEVDYFIYGHRHLPLEIPINNSVYFNTGDWLVFDSFLEYTKSGRIQLH